MATQTIGAATIADIENALVDQYGRTYLKQLVKTDSSAEWTFRYTSRTSAKCVVNNTAEGVTVTISAHTPTLAWVFMGIGYVFCVPGIIMTVWIIFTRTATNAVISHRFPKFVEAVQRAMSSHSTAPPPFPPDQP
jgi:hypothetical protein